MTKILAAFFLLTSCATSTVRAPSSALQLSLSEQSAYAKLLRDSIRYYSLELRHAESGQYYDARPLGEGIDYNSSVAATGMGLVALALGDATGNLQDAPEQAQTTMQFLLGRGTIGGQAYLSRRAKAGWFRHWFDTRNGADNNATRADGYSTIDTAILSAGAQLAANYFAAAGKDADGSLRRMADELLFSVKWSDAISNMEKGKLYLNYNLATEAPKASTAKFNEYILVACLGRVAEKRQGKSGPMTEFWNRHYADPSTLPTKSYEGIPLLTDHPGHFLSSFTMQFATYLCGDVSRSEEYLAFFSQAQKADQLWFEKQNAQPGFWGLGAGEVRYRDEQGNVKSQYHADSIDNNPHLIASPHIIAGFLPVHPEGIKDLLRMYARRDCTYRVGGYDLLWRCNLKDLKLPLDRLQAIDYSSMVLGLASLHPNVGLDFYRKHAVGAGILP